MTLNPANSIYLGDSELGDETNRMAGTSTVRPSNPGKGGHVPAPLDGMAEG